MPGRRRCCPSPPGSCRPAAGARRRPHARRRRRPPRSASALGPAWIQMPSRPSAAMRSSGAPSTAASAVARSIAVTASRARRSTAHAARSASKARLLAGAERRRSRRRRRPGSAGARPGGTSSARSRCASVAGLLLGPLLEQLLGRDRVEAELVEGAQQPRLVLEVRAARVAVPHLHRAPDELVAARALHAVDAEVGAADADGVLRRPGPGRVVLRGDQAVAGIERRGHRRAEVDVAEAEHEVRRRRRRCGGRRRRRRGR